MSSPVLSCLMAYDVWVLCPRLRFLRRHLRFLRRRLNDVKFCYKRLAIRRAKVASSVAMISVQCGKVERSVHTQLLLQNVCINCLILSILFISWTRMQFDPASDYLQGPVSSWNKVQKFLRERIVFLHHKTPINTRTSCLDAISSTSAQEESSQCGTVSQHSEAALSISSNVNVSDGITVGYWR